MGEVLIREFEILGFLRYGLLQEEFERKESSIEPIIREHRVVVKGVPICFYEGYIDKIFEVSSELKEGLQEGIVFIEDNPLRGLEKGKLHSSGGEYAGFEDFIKERKKKYGLV